MIEGIRINPLKVCINNFSEWRNDKGFIRAQRKYELIRTKINGTLDSIKSEEMSRKVFELLYQYKRPLNWLDNINFYVVTGQIIVPDNPINVILGNGFIRIEVQPEASADDFRAVYKNQYKVLKD